MPVPATLTATAALPRPAVYTTRAGTLTTSVTRKAGAVVTVSDLSAAKTSVT